MGKAVKVRKEQKGKDQLKENNRIVVKNLQQIVKCTFIILHLFEKNPQCLDYLSRSSSSSGIR